MVWVLATEAIVYSFARFWITHARFLGKKEGQARKVAPMRCTDEFVAQRRDECRKICNEMMIKPETTCNSITKQINLCKKKVSLFLSCVETSNFLAKLGIFSRLFVYILVEIKSLSLHNLDFKIWIAFIIGDNKYFQVNYFLFFIKESQSLN